MLTSSPEHQPAVQPSMSTSKPPAKQLVKQGYAVPYLRTFLLGLVAIIALLGWWQYRVFLMQVPERQVPQIQGMVLSPAKAIADFSLFSSRKGTNDNLIEQGFSNANLYGNWHLISYGYSHCPDICPTTMMVLAGLQQKIQQTLELTLEKAALQSVSPLVLNRSFNFVFYTIDPERDTLPLLAQYVSYFGSDFIGLRTTQAFISSTNKAANSFEASLGIKADVNKTNGYQVSHGVELFLINPEAQLQAVFMPSTDSHQFGSFSQEQLYQDLVKVISFYQANINTK